MCGSEDLENQMNGKTVTVTSDRYIDISKNKCLNFQKDVSHWMQDGAALHTSKAAINSLTDTFGSQLITL